MYFLKINDTVLPTPCYYSVTSRDIESSDSGRYDETGIVHRNRVRTNVRTCDVKWKIPGNMLDVLNVNLSDALLKVSMLDPSSEGYTECDMYAKNVKSDFFQHQNGNELSSWWEISCRLEEF